MLSYQLNDSGFTFVVEFVLVRNTFINVFGTQPVNKRLRIFQLLAFIVVKVLLLNF